MPARARALVLAAGAEEKVLLDGSRYVGEVNAAGEPANGRAGGDEDESRVPKGGKRGSDDAAPL